MNLLRFTLTNVEHNFMQQLKFSKFFLILWIFQYSLAHRSVCSKEKQDNNEKLLNVLAFGAVGDYDLKKRKGTDNVLPFQAALKKGSIYVPKGMYFLNINKSSQSVAVPSHRKIIFEKGATIVFGMEGVYYPAFVVTGKEDINFINPSFIWTGRLTYGKGMDNLNSDEESNLSNRFNTKYEYLNRHYCAAIWLAESNNIVIKGFRGESITRDGKSVIYNWIHAVRVDSLFIDNCRMNDMLLGIMSQGGSSGKISNITANRMSQDVGIPGHVIYSFRINCPIENVFDEGTETSLNGKLVSHTVSVKNRSDVKNIKSRRSEGVLNVGVDSSITISSIVWTENLRFPSRSSNPKLYFITSSKNNKLTVDDIQLEGKTANVSELVGGSTNNSIFTNVTLLRNDVTPQPKHGFFNLKGFNNNFNARLVESGNFCADVIKTFNGDSRNNTFNLELVDFTSSPVIKLETGSYNNEFKLSRRLKSKIGNGYISKKIRSDSLINGNKIIISNN